MSAIQKLDKNMEAQVKGISSYFQDIAEFDQDIAKADVATCNHESWQLPC